MTHIMPYVYFEELEVGHTYESAARTITQADIVNFAGISGDYNPIHMDHEFAKKTPYRQPIAHGFLVFSVASGLSIYAPYTKTVAMLGVGKWTFAHPAYIGDTIRIRSTVAEKILKGRGKRGEIVWDRSIINQDDKVLQEGTMMTLIECRPLEKRDLPSE